MGSRRLRWKLSFSRSPSKPSSPSSSITAEMPVEFLCPISRSLMADPVIISTGQSFERSCIQACVDLAFSPPSLLFPLDLSSPLQLIPNVALKSAIASWCERCGLPPPLPIPPDAASALVRRFMPASNPAPLSFFGAGKDDKGEVLRAAAYSYDAEMEKDEFLRSPAATFGGLGGKCEEAPRELAYSYGEDDEKGDVIRAPAFAHAGRDEKEEILRMNLWRSDENYKNSTSPNAPLPRYMRTKQNPGPYSTLSTTSSSSSSSFQSSSSYSSEIVVEGTAAGHQEAPRVPNLHPASNLPFPPAAEIDALEEEILNKLRDMEISEQESAAASLRQATRESRERRLALCTPRLLAALRPTLLSRSAAVQINAAAALVNLSLETANKVRIVRSGSVPPLVDVLKGGHPEAKDHAAAALFSLALEDENRAAIGVLGAIPPLVNLFARSTPDVPSGRKDAGMALYHLSVAITNRSKIVRTPGAVRALLNVAAEREETLPVAAQPQKRQGLARLAMMIVGNLAGCQEGRAALMDAGAVASVVDLMRGATAAEEEYCVAALYGMSRGSLRFRGLAKAAGAERVLMKVAEWNSGSGEVRREMARKTLRAMQGEDDEDAALPTSMGFQADEDGSVVSVGMKSFPPRQGEFGSGTGVNSAKF